MNVAKTGEHIARDSKVENNSAAPQERQKAASELFLPNEKWQPTDRWFIGFGAKESIDVPKNSVPKPLLDVLKKPASTAAIHHKAEYDRSKFSLTGLHAGDESRVEIALIAEGGGGGFADVMPDKDGFVITVPELIEFEGKSFTGDEFLQAVKAAKALFQKRSAPVTSDVSGSGAEKP